MIYQYEIIGVTHRIMSWQNDGKIRTEGMEQYVSTMAFVCGFG